MRGPMRVARPGQPARGCPAQDVRRGKCLPACPASKLPPVLPDKARFGADSCPPSVSHRPNTRKTCNPCFLRIFSQFFERATRPMVKWQPLFILQNDRQTAKKIKFESVRAKIPHRWRLWWLGSSAIRRRKRSSIKEIHGVNCCVRPYVVRDTGLEPVTPSLSGWWWSVF